MTHDSNSYVVLFWGEGERDHCYSSIAVGFMLARRDCQFRFVLLGFFFFFYFWLPYKKNFFAPEWTSANGIWQVNTSLLLFVSFVSVSLSTQVPLVGWQVILHWWLSPLLKRTCLWNLFPSSSFRSFSWPTSHLTLPLIQFPFFLFTHNCICILLS